MKEQQAAGADRDVLRVWSWTAKGGGRAYLGPISRSRPIAEGIPRHVGGHHTSVINWSI